MNDRSISGKLKAYLQAEVWKLTIGGAFQRANVYSPKADEHARYDFRAGIVKRIDEMIRKQYLTPVDEGRHLKNLLSLQKWIDTNYRHVLAGQHIRLGIVQKLLNLNLKYRWSMGDIPEPPHCPLDRIILGKLDIRPVPTWTSLDCPKEYIRLIDEVRVVAGSDSIAVWELRTYSRR